MKAVKIKMKLLQLLYIIDKAFPISQLFFFLRT